MKNLFHKIFIVGLLCFIGQVMIGQEVKMDRSSFTAENMPAGLSESLKNSILNGVDSLLNEYADAATLLDKEKRRVTEASVNRFSKLFNSLAQIPKDYLEFVPDELVSIREYQDGVYERLITRGVEVKLQKAELREILDDDEFYTVTVQVKKVIYNYISENKAGVQSRPSGKYFSQTFTFDVLKRDLNQVKIAKIMGAAKPVAAKYVRYIGPSIGFSIYSIKPQFSNHWNANHASQSTLSSSGNYGISLGVDYMTNILSGRSSPSKNLFLTVGLYYNQMRFNAELQNFSLSEFDAIASTETASLDYKRILTSLQATENLNISAISVPVGVSYRLVNKPKWDFFASLRLIPTFAFGSSGNLSGIGTYAAALPASNWRSDAANAINPNDVNDPEGFGPFIIGDQNLDNTANPTINSLTFAGQFSPTFYFHLSDQNPNWSLMIGLDVTYQFSPILQSDNAEGDIFQFPDDYETSFLQHYTSGMNILSGGIRLGLQHRLKTNP